MSSSSFDWSLKKWCWGMAWLIPLLCLCVRYLDVPLALWVQDTLYGGDSNWARHTSHLPDLLLPLVLLTTAASVPWYLVRKRRGINDSLNLFLILMAWTAPTSYLFKGVLKQIFGRVNTRVWLDDQALYSFHWFQGGQGFEGFPSGHMLVVMALAAALWRFFPRHRSAVAVVMALLAAALIATNYHFLSDVLAGGYLALGVEGFVFRLLAAPQRQPGGCQGG